MTIILPVSPLPSWAPTLNEVGALITTRTRDSSGVELGTFSEDTRPTDIQAGHLLKMAVGEIEDKVRRDIPIRYEDDARRLAALRTAVLIEGSFSSDQVESSSSAKMYQAMYLEGADRLERRLKVTGSVQMR